MDSDGSVKVVLCCPHSDGNVVALCDLPGIRTEHMEPHHTFLHEGGGAVVNWYR